MSTAKLAISIIGAVVMVFYFTSIFPDLLTAPSDIAVALAFAIPGLPAFAAVLWAHSKYNRSKLAQHEQNDEG